MAFEQLEEEVARGRIQYYGISSNTLAFPSTARTHLRDRLLQAAARVSSNNYFRVIQYPLNVVEGDAAVIANLVNNTVTVSEMAVVCLPSLLWPSLIDDVFSVCLFVCLFAVWRNAET